MSYSPPPSTVPFRRRLRSTRGFTIMEVALASFVLAMGISTSIIAMQSAFRFLDVARDTTLASQVLQSEIERLRMMSWAGVTALPASEVVNLSTMFSSDANLASRFTVVRAVASDADRPADVRIITLSVAWRSYDGRSHTRRFETKYVKNGLYDYYYTLARP
ncbi:MAG: hypothetical protein EXS37_17690 [Opitutus sp.]|nr:hypothetical protein [Opitutus sp.]